MARPTLQAITGAIDTNNSLQKINENFDAIEAGFADTLSRSGVPPNYMDNTLDMNSNRIINLRSAVNATEPVTLAQAGQIAGFTSLTQAVIGSYLWPQTSEEVAASVTPTYYYYPPGDVRRYGAVGDGVTNDTTPVLSAIQVAEQGTPGYFPEGYTFLCSTWSQYATTAAIHLHGGGTLKNDSTDIFLQPGAAVTLDGLTFDTWLGVLENATADPGTVTELSVRNCSFLTMATHTINLERPVDRADISHNYFNAVSNYAIRIGEDLYASQDTWQRISVTHNVAINIDSTGATNAAFALIYGKYADISHNHIEDVDSVTGECWAIYTKCRYATICNNRIIDLATSGASLFAINVKGANRTDTNTPQGYAVVVSGNVLKQVTVKGTGIRIQNEDVLVSGNFVEGFASGISGSSGAAYKNQNIIGNTIICPNTDANVYGISLVGQVDGLVCDGNSIYLGGIGIRINADVACGKWSITGNVIRGSGFGMASNSTATISNISICDNVITESATDGIYVQYMDRVKIHDNTISPTTGDEIDFAGSNIITGLSLRHRSELQTTDATVTSVLQIPLADNTAMAFDIHAIAMESNGTDRARYSLGALGYRNGAGAALQGASYSNITAIESDATWGGPVISVSGNEVLGRVYGVAAQTINWTVNITAESVA